MTTLALANNWKDWAETKDGNGTIDFSLDNKLVTVSANNSSRAYMLKRLNVSAGEKITVSVLASASAGDVALTIDYPSAGIQKSLVTISGDDIEKYTCEFSVPYNHNPDTDFIQIGIGSFSTTGGTADVSTPVVSSTNSPVGFLKTHLLGLISLSKSGGVLTPSVNTSYTSAGINSVEYDNSSQRLKIFMAKMPGVSRTLPVFDTGMTIDLLPQIQAKIGQYTNTTGQVSIRFIDETGSFVDLESVMSDGETAFCWVKGVG